MTHPRHPVSVEIIDANAELIRYGWRDGAVNHLPCSFGALVDDPKLAVLLTIWFEQIGQTRRVHVKTITISARKDRSLADKMVHNIKLLAYAEVAVMEALIRVDADSGKRTKETNRGKQRMAAERFRRENRQGHPGRPGLRDEVREKILVEYEQLVNLGEDRIAEKVADSTGVSKSTVYRVVREATDA